MSKFVKIFCYVYNFADVLPITEQGTSSTVTAVDEVNLNKSAKARRDVTTKLGNPVKGKIFKRLIYIVVVFHVLWTPWYLTFDVNIFRADLINSDVYDFTVCLTFWNAAINSILYAMGSRNNRTVMKRLFYR